MATARGDAVTEPATAALGASVDVQTDAGEVTMTVVGGSRPYLWIGRGGDYLDSIDLRVILKAASAAEKRFRRGR